MNRLEVCKNCGLPKELCVCGTIAKEEARIKIYTTKRSFGKLITVIEGVTEETNPKELTKKLKTKLACGGTFKNGRIELQGNHKSKIKGLLVKAGFPEDKIEIS